MKFENLSPELQEKARQCKSPEEILALAEEEGYELTDEEIAGISGGDWSCWTVCTGYDPYYCYTNDPGPR